MLYTCLLCQYNHRNEISSSPCMVGRTTSVPGHVLQGVAVADLVGERRRMPSNVGCTTQQDPAGVITCDFACNVLTVQIV
jgi:hypothetical protein